MSRTIPSAPDQRLPELLKRYTQQVLQTIGQSLGLTPPLLRGRDPLIRAIVDQMHQAEAVQAAWDRLDARDRELLRLIQAMGGQCPTATLSIVAVRERLIDPDPPRVPTRTPGQQPLSPPTRYTLEQVIIRLQESGLVLVPDTDANLTRAHPSPPLSFALRDRVLIPQPVRERLPPLPPPDVILADDTPLTVVPGDASTFQRDLYLYWSAVRDTRVLLTNRGLVNKTHLKRINATLTNAEPLDTVRDEQQTGWLRFVRTTLTGCCLVQIEPDPDRLAITPDSEPFFTRPLAERTRVVLNTYQRSTAWNELVRHPHLVIDGCRASDLTPAFVVSARETVLHLLHTLGEVALAALANKDAPGEPYPFLSMERLLAHLQRTHYDFLLSRQIPMNPYRYTQTHYHRVDPYRSYGNPAGWNFSTRTHILDESNGWSAVEAGFVEVMLREPLRWMGLVDLGTVTDARAPWGNRLVAIRLTPLGAHLLTGAPLPQDAEPTGGRLIVQPTFEVLVSPPVAETHLALLDRIAERVQLDQAAVYRLTRDSLYLARQQHGLAVADVLGILERESGNALPQNVAYTLQEWGRAQERVTLSDQVLLIQADAAILDQLAAWHPTTYRRKGNDDPAPSLLLRRLTPTAALLHRDARAQVEQALFAMGHLPVSYQWASTQGLPPTRASPASGSGMGTGSSRAGPPDSPYLTVTAEGQISLWSGAPRLYLRQQLRPFTVEEGAVLRITRARVQQAVKDGLFVERILDMLRTWSADPLPDELVQTLKRWGGYYGRISLDRPLLLRLSDQRTLDTLLSDPEIGPLVQRYQPQGILAQVQPADLERLQALLAARGVDLRGEG